MIVGLILAAAGLGIVARQRAWAELLAAGLVAAVILTTYYALNREDTMTEQTPDTPPTGEALVLTQLDGGGIRVENATPPEHITLDRELWDAVREDNDPADGETRPVWVETIGHQDPEVPNDGYMLHVDAVNVACSYRVSSLADQGPVRATLASWGEKQQ